MVVVLSVQIKLQLLLNLHGSQRKKGFNSRDIQDCVILCQNGGKYAPKTHLESVYKSGQ